MWNKNMEKRFEVIFLDKNGVGGKMPIYAVLCHLFMMENTKTGVSFCEDAALSDLMDF